MENESNISSKTYKAIDESVCVVYKLQISCITFFNDREEDMHGFGKDPLHQQKTVKINPITFREFMVTDDVINMEQIEQQSQAVATVKGNLSTIKDKVVKCKCPDM